MTALGLDATYGAYLDVIPGVTLATVNLMSLFGLHRRWRGGIVGPPRAVRDDVVAAQRPLRARPAAARASTAATPFFDEHVEADAVHENIAAVDLAGGLARAEPALTGEIVWGARALAELDARWARHVLESWERGVSSLWAPSPSRAPA